MSFVLQVNQPFPSAFSPQPRYDRDAIFDLKIFLRLRLALTDRFDFPVSETCQDALTEKPARIHGIVTIFTNMIRYGFGVSYMFVLNRRLFSNPSSKKLTNYGIMDPQVIQAVKV